MQAIIITRYTMATLMGFIVPIAVAQSSPMVGIFSAAFMLYVYLFLRKDSEASNLGLILSMIAIYGIMDNIEVHDLIIHYGG